MFDGIGFIHLLTKELWDGHPCCAFTVSKEFATQNPNSYRALLKAIIDATAYAHKQENRKEVSSLLQNYIHPLGVESLAAIEARGFDAEEFLKLDLGVGELAEHQGVLAVPYRQQGQVVAIHTGTFTKGVVGLPMARHERPAALQRGLPPGRLPER